jgi:predicted GIY-YIG superfamily endonuclease
MSRYKSSYQRESSPDDLDDSDDDEEEEESDHDTPRKRRLPSKFKKAFNPKKKIKSHKKNAFTPPPISGIYVLENLSGGTPRFYVGKSNNIIQRVNAHMSGQGGVGYLSGRNLRHVSLISNGSLRDLESWERNETLERMYRFGINNVRGWMFTDLELSDEDHETAFNQICEKRDLCRRCGRNSHFQGNCYARSTAEWSGGMEL